MLLDTASLYFRAFYGVPDTVTAPDGTPVNAIRGLLDMMTRLVRARQPTSLVACWVADGVAEEIPPALTIQVPVIEELLTAAGIPVMGHEGCEADDIIGTLATRSQQPVDVVTGDRDLFQLVDD